MVAYPLFLGWIRVVGISTELKLATRFRQPLAIASQATVVEALKYDG